MTPSQATRMIWCIRVICFSIITPFFGALARDAWQSGWYPVTVVLLAAFVATSTLLWDMTRMMGR